MILSWLSKARRWAGISLTADWANWINLSLSDCKRELESQPGSRKSWTAWMLLSRQREKKELEAFDPASSLSKRRIKEGLYWELLKWSRTALKEDFWLAPERARAWKPINSRERASKAPSTMKTGSGWLRETRLKGETWAFLRLWQKRSLELPMERRVA